MCSGFTVGLFAYYERHDVDAGEGRRGRSICRLPQSHRFPRARALDLLARSVHSLCSARRNGPRMFRRCTLLCTPSTRSQRVAAVAPTCSPSKDRARCHGASRDIMRTRAPCLSHAAFSRPCSLFEWPSYRSAKRRETKRRKENHRLGMRIEGPLTSSTSTKPPLPCQFPPLHSPAHAKPTRRFSMSKRV